MVALLLLVACTGGPPHPVDSSLPDDTAPTGDSGDGIPAGELRIEQLDLGSSWIGEAALVIGPDGTTVLIDVGSSQHTSEVRAELDAHGVTSIDHVVLTHEDSDHVGGFDDLFSGNNAVAITGRVLRQDLTELPTSIELGHGAVLTIFLASGQLATSNGVVDLSTTVDLGSEDNPRSLAGVISWGTFDYLFAGDLTGGGKGTPDVESAVVAHADDLPWVPADGVDVVHVSHHGISSSTNATWTGWLRPSVAVVGANNAYLDAPSEEALEALAPWVDAVWVTEDGLLGNQDERTTVAHGSVAVCVLGDGTWRVCLP